MRTIAVKEPAYRSILFRETSEAIGVSPALVEKDFWVCWTLKRIFSIPDLKDNVIFKGGTTLSKVYGIIRRFSEDIDLTLDRSLFGFGGEKNPDAAPSNKKRKKYCEEMVDACAAYIQNDFRILLHNDFIQELDESDTWDLIVDPEATDGQSLWFQYPRACVESSYVRPMVKIELGSRADFWPAEKREIKPYAAEAFPDVFEYPHACVSALKVERTFWEKLTILHEEAHRPAELFTPARYARHYYDVAMLAQHVADVALNAKELLTRVVEHKTLFYKRSWSRYDTAIPGTFVLVPGKKRIAELTRDYANMQEMMIGKAPSFSEILDTLSDLERRVNSL